MLLIPCPWCGERPEIEFRNAGEAHISRPQRPDDASDEVWDQFLFTRTNPKGSHRERWRHVHGCGRFFNVARDTVSDVIRASYAVGQSPPDLDAKTSS